jgi:hypothetical protein
VKPESERPEWLAAWEAFERKVIENWDGLSPFPGLKEVFREGWNAGVLATINDRKTNAG